MQAAAEGAIKAKDAELQAQKLEAEMKALLSAEEFERWKAGKMAELERVRLEREALERLSLEEVLSSVCVGCCVFHFVNFVRFV